MLGKLYFTCHGSETDGYAVGAYQYVPYNYVGFEGQVSLSPYWAKRKQFDSMEDAFAAIRELMAQQVGDVK